MHKLAGKAIVLDSDLSEIRLLLERYAGVLIDHDSEKFRAAVADYADFRHLNSGAELIALLRSSSAHCDGLLENLISGETSFFRYPQLFAAFQKAVMPEIAARKAGENPRSLRIWSAGCSTGEEAYSVAVSVCETLRGGSESWNIHIVASDIRREALTLAERGLYHEAALADLPREWIASYFARVGDHLLVKPRLRNLITFTPMNLAQANFIGRFDCIFCLDVLPHFSACQRIALLQRLHMFLEPGGYLFLGEEERIGPGANFMVETQGNCTYYRRALTAAAHAGK